MTHQALSLTPSRPNSTWPSWVPWSHGALDEETSTKKQMLVKGHGKHKITWYFLFRYEKQPWISWLHETSNDCIGLLMINFNEPKLQQCDTRTSSTTVGNTLSSYRRKREKMWNVKSCQAVTHRCQAFFAFQCLKECQNPFGHVGWTMFPASPQLGRIQRRTLCRSKTQMPWSLAPQRWRSSIYRNAASEFHMKLRPTKKKWIMMISPTVYHAPTPPNTLPSHCLKLPP